MDSDPTPAFSAKLKRIVDRGLSFGILNQREADYICVPNPTVVVFHTLPKVHKGGPPPFRPRMVGIGSPNEHLSSLSDSYLQPLVSLLRRYLIDTKQVLLALENQSWSIGAKWITADVSSLYTVIPHDKA